MVPVQLIKQCKIFKMFPEDMVEQVAGIGIPVIYKAGEMLFNVDEPAHNLAVLMKGRVEILTTKRTQFVPIHIVMPGEAFALSSMITGRFVSAARAAEDSEVCALPVDKFTQIIEQDYKVAYLFMKQIAILVSSRLLRIHYQLDAAGPGFA